jgi:PAS domain S-box-containing protein
MLLDSGGHADYCSEKFRKLAGIKNGDMPEGLHFREIYKLFERASFIENEEKRFREIKNNHVFIESYVDINFPGNGETRSYMVQYTPLLDEDGSFFGAQVVYHDTLEPHQAAANKLTRIIDFATLEAIQQKARETEERSRAMLNALPLACSLWDDQANILYCNQEALRIFELSSEEEYRKHIRSLSPEFQDDGTPSREGMNEKVRLAFETGYQQFEWIHCTMNGELLPVETTIVKIANEDNCHIAFYARDLREQKAAEAKVREADRHSREMEIQTLAAENASKSKSAFLATMSHEIRTPLNAIIGLSEIELQKRLPEDTHADLEKIYNSGSTLLGIINDILDISKIETGNFELIPEPYDVPSLINDTVQLNIIRIGTKPIAFTLAINETIPARLYGDELRVKQILNNLLSNAFKYTDQGTVILRVDWEQADDGMWLILAVSDTGHGIKDEDLGRLFSEYAQLDTRANRHIEGTGLGLPIAKNMVELMGGTITLESEYGKGSVFTVRIRQGIIDPSPIGAEIVENIRLYRFTKNRTGRDRNLIRSYMPYGRVLIVDDVETNLDVARGLILPYGLAIDCASSGREAIEKIRAIGDKPESKKYDVVFMDHMMPGMDGIEAVRIIRNEIDSGYARSIPIIALTANALKGNEDMFLSHGFNAYISKPIDIFQLDTVLNTWVRNKQTVETLRQAELEQAVNEEEDRPVPTGLFDGYEIAGIDLAAGKERYTYDTVYLDIIRSYCVHTPVLLERIRGFPAGELDQYTITVHGLKGSSYGICADAAGQYAETLEMAARVGDIETIKTKNDEFIEIMERLLSGLNGMLANIEKSRGKKERAAAPEQAVLIKLLEACKQYQTMLMEKAVIELEKYEYDSGGELVLWLREQLDNLEYDAIRYRLESIRKTGIPKNQRASCVI